MSVTLVIPSLVFWLIGAYYLTGLVLYVPLVMWQSKFISPRRKGFACFDGMRVKRLLVSVFFASGLFWSFIVFDCLRYERRYGFLKN